MLRLGAVALIVMLAGCADGGAQIDPDVAALAQPARERLALDAGEGGAAIRTETTVSAAMTITSGSQTMEAVMELETVTTYHSDGLAMELQMDVRMPSSSGSDVQMVTSLLCNPQGIVVEVVVDGETQRHTESVSGSCYDIDPAQMMSSMGGGGDMGMGSMLSMLAGLDGTQLEVVRTRGSVEDARVTERFQVTLPLMGIDMSLEGSMTSHIVAQRTVDWSIDATLDLSTGSEMQMGGQLKGSSSIEYGARTAAPAGL